MSCDITDKDHPLGWSFTNVNKTIVGMTDKEIAKKTDFLEFNKTVSLVDVALCTSAAPTYFEGRSIPFKGKDKLFVDGGIIANNPAFYAQIMAHENVMNMADIMHVSLGTGYMTGDKSENTKSSRTNRLLFWASYLGEASIDGQSRVTHENMKRLCNTFSDGVQRYYRFAPNFGDLDEYSVKKGLNLPELPSAIGMDDCTPKAMRFYTEAANMMIETPAFDAVVEIIKGHLRGQ